MVVAMAGKKTIFFDRDGTLIIDKVYLNDPNQIVYLDGVFESLTLLRDAGFEFVIVTNQSGVARGLVTLENLDEIHRRISNEFSRHGIHFVGIYYAPYSVESNHHMRKPNPGMLEAAATEHGLDLGQSWIVGDRMSDIEAGYRAGCRTILLEGTERPEDSPFRKPHAIAKDILDAAHAILAMESQSASAGRSALS